MYQYSGDTVINSIQYQYLSKLGYIREDTLLNKVFIWSTFGEMTLYDFSLEVSDSIYYLHTNEYHRVLHIDSVQINSIWYKVIKYEIINSNDFLKYTLIENIGCVDGLKLPIDPYKSASYDRFLQCFLSDGLQPVLNRAVATSNTNFSNTDSCYVFSQNVSVNNVLNLQEQITISPHPANAGSVINLPYTLQSGKLTIYNTIGQTVRQSSFSNTSKLAIGQLPGAGMYYYRVSDKTNGKVWHGKVVYE